MNEMLKQRRYLNEIHNIDKRIINHSYIQTYSNINSPNNTKENNTLFYKNQINSINSFPNLTKLNNYLPQNKKIKTEN